MTYVSNLWPADTRLNACMQVWLGFVINNAVLPFCMVYTFFQPHIEWSGVHYYKSGGRIVRVER